MQVTIIASGMDAILQKMGIEKSKKGLRPELQQFRGQAKENKTESTQPKR